jgi:hypothetical protein
MRSLALAELVDARQVGAAGGCAALADALRDFDDG